MELVSCIAMCLSLAFLLPSPVAATAPTGMVERETKQHILASIPPHWEENPVLFLTSPSGKYAAYFMRSQTAPGAGGLGADFCYVEILDTTEPGAEGRSVWESECLAVSTVNTCALVFSWEGLEVFDGSNSVWHTHDTESVDNNFIKTLQLVDEGDMRILDKGGELAWKASDEPRAAQHCGMPGSPGLAPAMPPFADPIGKGSSNLPFGQDEGGNGNSYGSVGGVAQPELPLAPGGVGGQGQAVESVGETMGLGSQPLVDNSPYDSGAPGRPWAGVANLGLSVAIAIAMGLGL
ncbi:hypothetical protein CFC21_058237 [Triticum aestivum]|uniref:non-specific serine/threonine protein kinase n=3 Tax=Triticum TaxID=4564 RepID=A0A9R0TB06_TRITD|nr:uncharacterized protein LOC119293772 [Triticum dicoccoides]XP_044372777.1 uncharacterized protein LOC123095003 [Triticum aestivum]KAF7049751.1 hypothetical protein CFC21_058237 [Triticum aestivum]VAI07773.1 unnamed protein product [Triticum turgidum subsp. durum]